MTYTVVWKTSAEQELAALWLSASDRNAVSAATNLAEKLLRQAPLALGESRGKSRRVMFLPPLVFFFQVSPADRLVTVTGVRRWGGPSQLPNAP